jgi:methionyl-tRNA formyltransferase
MRLIFCGTPQFAVPTLERLVAEKFLVELAVTNPDEPSGRGYELKSSAVKQAAERAGLPIFQPPKLKDPATVEFLSRFQPDAIVVVAYGHILPSWMIALPRLGCINLHASLLPKYRGAAPIQWAIIRGERVTGVTTMRIDAGLDTGDVLLKREVEILDEDTTETLSERLGTIGAGLMVETLRGLERGEITPVPQNHPFATLAPLLKKEDGRIPWSLTAEEIARRVRGLRPWPGAYAGFRGKNLHLWAAAVSQASEAPAAPDSAPPPGQLIVQGGRLYVACGQGTLLEVREVQLEGRKRIPARDFLNGVRIIPGEKLE